MDNHKLIEIDGRVCQLCPDHLVPTDDPEFPSYNYQEYDSVDEDLELVYDVYEGSKEVKKYLPQWEREPNQAYKNRLKRTLFQNFFRSAVHGFPGFLSDIQGLEKLYKGLRESIKNIDGKGNDLMSFLWQADLKVIRDGYCGILVDCPKPDLDEYGEPKIKTLADQSRVTILPCPYLVLIDRRDILNWCETKIGLERVTIRETVLEKLGTFGSQCVTRYRTFCDDGSYCVQVILIRDDDEPYVVTIEEGVIGLKEIPLIFYSATEINPTSAVPPLLNLAEKNIAHYELYSEYREIIHKINNPTAVRVGVVQPGQMDYSRMPPLILGANTAIDVPTGGDFKFVEPTGTSLATDRAELDKLEMSMNLDTLKFVSGGEGAKTATEIMMDSTQTQATLSGLATLKQSMIEQVAEKWARYYGDEGQGGSCVVSKDLMIAPMSSVDMATLSNMAMENQISIISLLELLSQNKRLPKDVTPALEIKRLAAERVMREKLDAKMKLKDKDQETNNGTNSTPNGQNQS